MCGITGFIDYAGRRGGPEAKEILRSMTDAVAHRGPDGDGYWHSAEHRVGLGHRRLSIVDLSAAGAQPMESASGRYVVTFNGEFYGFLDLRRELESRGVRFRGHSDTEVMLAAVELYGFESAIDRLNGMFALAILDRHARQLHLVRDRLGKKPLYIGVGNGTVAFASELKALRCHPDFASPDIDTGALSLFVRHNYIPTPYSIYKQIVKLPAGHWTTLSLDRPPPDATSVVKQARAYWSVADAIEKGISHRTDDEAGALEDLDDTLKRVVKERLVADVPVGAFLSGGIDSSLIAAIIKDVSNAGIKTYTIRFAEQKFNEADNALAVAKALGADHTEITATPEMALQRVERLPHVYDEPFADSSQLPTMIVSELARSNVTVAVSGDGGDELFGGYNRYTQMRQFKTLSDRIPQAAIAATGVAPLWLLESVAGLSRPFLPANYRNDISGDRIRKAAELLRIEDFNERYLAFLSQWKSPSSIVLGGVEPATAMNPMRPPAALSELERMMYVDTVAYLPDDVLVKVDRASMSVALEMRSPLLDHRFVEAAWRAPASLRLVNGSGKIALRRLLERRLPAALFNRPKHGFSVPINDWLRGPLRNYAGDMLAAARILREGLFDPAPVVRAWNEHQSGRRNWGPQLWTILMYNAWSDVWRRSSEPLRAAAR